MQKYVTGFLFSTDATEVVLIKKINPQWQAGLFNGVGGKIEANEASCDAMTREFAEETGVSIAPAQWTCYACIYRPNHYHVDVYFAYSELAYSVRSVEQEQVKLCKVDELPSNLIPNLRWLIPMALDKQADFSRPFTLVEIAEERIKP